MTGMLAQTHCPQSYVADDANRMATKPNNEASNYMQELTRYLKNIMNSVLLALPTDIKEFIYFDALSHASSAILVGATP